MRPPFGSGERPSRAFRRTPEYQGAARALGLRVRALRHAAGLTLQQLAERADLDVRHVQKLEAAVLNVSLVTLVRVARGLGVPLSELFTPPAPPPGSGPEEAGPESSEGEDKGEAERKPDRGRA